MVEWSKAQACVRILLPGYWGFDPRFRVGPESGWKRECIFLCLYVPVASTVGDTLESLGQAKPEALALVRLRFVWSNVQ